MAEFRQIHTRIWKDDWFSELDLDARLLFIYLFSNEQAEVGGVYELPIKYMAVEVGMTNARILKLLAQFEQAGKVFYRGKWVWVVNLRKYNETKSDSVAKRIKKDLDLLPNGELKEMYCRFHNIPCLHPVPTVSTPDLKSNGGVDTRFKSAPDTDTETETEKKDTETPNDYFWADETPDNDSAITQLSKQFEVSANMTAHNMDKWDKALQEMHAAGAKPEDIAHVVHVMKCPPKGGKKLTVAGPWSCTNMVIAYIADQRSGGSLGIDRGLYDQSQT